MTADLVATFYAAGEFPDGTGTEMDCVTQLSFMADLRGPGSLTLEQLNVATVKAEMGGIITVDVLGSDRTPVRAFAAFVTADSRDTVAQLEANQRTTLQLPGHLAVAGQGLIGPPNGDGSLPVVDEVAFNWTHPDYDDSGWSAATAVATTFSAQALVLDAGHSPWAGDDYQAWYESEIANVIALRDAFGTPFILGGPPVEADIIGPSDGTELNVASPNAPNQNHYIRQEITVPAAGRYTLHTAADNNAEFYIDQALVATVNTWKDDTYDFVDLSAGTHIVAVMLQNVPQTAPNPCGMSWSLWDAYYPTSTCVAFSDASAAVALEYQAEPPGMTATNATRLAFAPHVAAGESWAIAFASAFDFDDVNGSDSNPLPIEPNLTAQTRDTLGDLINKIQQSYADVILDPSSWALHVYDIDTFTPASGLVLSYPGNITSLTHKREKALADKLRVRTTALGWITVGTGETEVYVELGTETAVGDVARIGNQILDIYGQERLEITATYQPMDDSEIPWVNNDLVPGAMASVPDRDGSLTSERIMALGCSISENAPNLAVQITLKDRIQDLNERILTEVTQ